MAVQANPEHSVDEGALHFFARESQTFLLWTVYILLGVTLVTMIFFFPFVILPATLLILAYLLLMVTNVVERRSNRDAPASADTAASAPGPAATSGSATSTRSVSDAGPVSAGLAEPGEELAEYEKPWAMPMLKHETKVVAVGILAVLILAIVLAATRFGGVALIVAVFFLFAYIVLLTAPVWMAALEDDIEDVSHREPKVEPVPVDDDE